MISIDPQSIEQHPALKRFINEKVTFDGMLSDDDIHKPFVVNLQGITPEIQSLRLIDICALMGLNAQLTFLLSKPGATLQILHNDSQAFSFSVTNNQQAILRALLNHLLASPEETQESIKTFFRNNLEVMKRIKMTDNDSHLNDLLEKIIVKCELFSLHDVRKKTRALKEALPLQPHNGTLKERLLFAYTTECSIKLHSVLSLSVQTNTLDVKVSGDINDYLIAAWRFISGTPLTYTANHSSMLTSLHCDLACLAADFKYWLEEDAEHMLSPSQLTLQYLMPTVGTESLDEEKYPNLYHIPLETILS